MTKADVINAAQKIRTLVGPVQKRTPTGGYIDVDIELVIREVISGKGVYRTKYVPKKKSGAFRVIDAPNDDLKAIQRTIHHNLLKINYDPTPICHSFVGRRNAVYKNGSRYFLGRTPVSNAFAHLGLGPDQEPDYENEDVEWREPRSIILMDMRHAFPTVTRRRVLGIYKRLVNDELVARALTLLSTWNGAIPQGAPTSPLLLNFACLKLDGALKREFGRGAFVVTRYVDDIAVSLNDPKMPDYVRKRLEEMVSDNGFVVNPEKTSCWRDNQRVLRVTGMNLSPGDRMVELPPATIERFRLLLYHSLRSIKEAVGIKLSENPDVTIQYLVPGIIQKSLGRVRGITGFCNMVYGPSGHEPKRLSDWLARPEKGIYERIREETKRVTYVDETWDAIHEAWNS